MFNIFDDRVVGHMALYKQRVIYVCLEMSIMDNKRTNVGKIMVK